ncbi:cellulose biosynthesis protein BcsG [Photobacterium halotolerans]|uniref:Membrane protein n=1 Tax=Photobacterium halotolerans TaxID=265726 RepID=A0A0F5VCI3_9GAMM|nr:cellulose biosynthesis protein BcsG [Photobacterium halotolerans]KKC99511.1 membrane protein [Photobacterium halotolerans]
MTIPLASHSPQPVQGLGWWNVYFIAKFALYLQGTIDFHPLENVALALFLLLPLRSRLLAAVRLIIAVPAAAWLLHYDSFLPPLDRLWAQMNQLMHFEWGYLFELAGRFISVQALLGLFAVCIGYHLLNRFLRVSVLVMAAMLFISLPSSQIAPVIADQGTSENNPPITRPAGNTNTTAANMPAGTDDASLNQYVSEFFSREAKRQVLFEDSAVQAAPFDILLLSICSVAWDDIRIAGLEDHPLLKEFDVLFDQFNAATSYSGPAVIRLLRASCGQENHSQLFAGAPSQQCYLFDNLKQLGFEENLVMNHDGVFDNFLELIQTEGNVTADLMPQTDFSPYQKSFDGAPIYRDKDVLNHWWQQRQQEGSDKVVALYNTISLHDGNRIIHGNQSTGLVSYKLRLKNLLDDLYAFFQSLEQSGRNIVVVLVPEHGAGMKGDRMQITGMREIPSPSIVHTPVGLRVFGKDIVRTGETARVTAPSSYLALSQLVANVLEQNPYLSGSFDPAALIGNLPATPVVAQNEGSTVIRVQSKNYVTLDGSNWSEYPAK